MRTRPAAPPIIELHIGQVVLDADLGFRHGQDFGVALAAEVRETLLHHLAGSAGIDAHPDRVAELVLPPVDQPLSTQPATAAGPIGRAVAHGVGDRIRRIQNQVPR
jgi:hypothetical protein